jgi:hypothetical protein
VPGPPAGSPKPGNGLAIAALILGILAVLCLGPIAGIVAIILGVLGIKKASEVGTGKGMSIAGLVLGIIGTLVWVIVVIALVAGGDELSDRLDDFSGPADTSDYDLTTDSCDIDEFGSVSFTGTIENTAGREMSFTITGEIRSTDSDVVLESPSTYIEVSEDDTARWELVTFLDDPENITCEVTDVDNFLN